MFIAANWKMNGKLKDFAELKAVLDYVKKTQLSVKLALCLPATLLYYANQQFYLNYAQLKNVYLGAQDAHWLESGAYTGDISPSMLYDCGARYVILGHYERRKYYLENNTLIKCKISCSVNSGLKTIVCVGEGCTSKESIKKQFSELLPPLTEQQIKESFLTIAYEPIWAIGSGKTPLPQDIAKIHNYIKDALIDYFGAELAGFVKIIYGGSVTHKNIADIINIKVVDGVLLGGASLKALDFIPLLKGLEKINLAK